MKTSEAVAYFPSDLLGVVPEGFVGIATLSKPLGEHWQGGTVCTQPNGEQTTTEPSALFIVMMSPIPSACAGLAAASMETVTAVAATKALVNLCMW